METTTATLPNLDIMSSYEQPQQYLKLEDLHNTPATPASSDFNDAASPPASVVVTSKAAKKRKSWGQELPEPKTALPPRKRAKTDDEKEQRRIERIKRNRAAAHNSRERKRQETETLAVALAKANAQLEAYRNLHGPLPPGTVLPEVHLKTLDGTECSSTSPVPSHFDSRYSVDMNSPESPREASPSVTIKQESTHDSTLNSIQLLSPPADNLDMKKAAEELDQAQHSAAMLSDLQCRSSPSASPSSSTTAWWANLILYMLMASMQTCYKTILTAIWTISPSRMERLIALSTSRLTSRSTTSSTTTLHLWRSMALAQRNAATGLTSTERGALALQQRATMRRPDASQRASRGSNVSVNEASVDRLALNGQKDRDQANGADDDGGVGR